MQEIRIDIDEHGNVRVAATGIDGPDCVKLTAAIEAALGDVQKQQKTAEFHTPPRLLRKK